MTVQTSLGQFKSGTLSALDPATGTASVRFDDGATESEIILSRVSISAPRAMNTTNDLDSKTAAPCFSALPISPPATVLHATQQSHDQQQHHEMQGQIMQSKSRKRGVGSVLSALPSMNKQGRTPMIFLPLVVFPTVVLLLAIVLSFIYAAK